jgi:hypothetical protein
VREVGVGAGLEYHSGKAQKGCENREAVVDFEQALNDGKTVR